MLFGRKIDSNRDCKLFGSDMENGAALDFALVRCVGPMRLNLGANYVLSVFIIRLFH